MDEPRLPPHYDDLGAVEDTAWTMMVDAVPNRRAAFHQVTVANLGADGEAEARTVVLRGADRAARTVRFHTDRRSGKFAALSAHPRASVHLYDHDAKVQIRLRGTAALHTGDALAEGLWSTMRDMSKVCYRQPVGPGAPIAAPDGAMDGGLLADADGFANFVAVVVHIHQLEWLYLAAKGHRRALLDYGGDTPPRWLAP
ncbi:MAG: pyridoxamine 5'-phosphate oxidase family protein [Pseudomonadota bacterium]